MKAAALLFSVTLLLACLPTPHATSVWNQGRGSAQKSNSVAVNGAGSSCNIAWSVKDADVMTNCESWGTFITDGTRIFVLSYNVSQDEQYMEGKLAALNANTGAVSWTAPVATVTRKYFFTAEALLQQAVVSPSSGLVFVLGSLDTMLVLNTATGSKLWSFVLPGGAVNSFALDDSEATLLLLDKYNVTAYSVSRRSIAWTTQVNRFDCMEVAVNTSANYVAVMCSTELKVFRLSDGAPLWSLNTPEESGVIALDATCIYAQYYGRSTGHGIPIVDCYDPQTGRLLWGRRLRDEHDYRADGSFDTGPIVTSKGTIVGTPVDNYQYLILALDPQTGLDKWRYTHPTMPITVIADAASVLYLIDQFEFAYAITAIPVGGTQVWNATFLSIFCTESATVIGSNSLAIVSSTNYIKTLQIAVPTVTLINTDTANQACPSFIKN